MLSFDIKETFPQSGKCFLIKVLEYWIRPVWSSIDDEGIVGKPGL